MPSKIKQHTARGKSPKQKRPDEPADLPVPVVIPATKVPAELNLGRPSWVTYVPTYTTYELGDLSQSASEDEDA